MIFIYLVFIIILIILSSSSYDYTCLMSYQRVLMQPLSRMSLMYVGIESREILSPDHIRD